MDSEVFSGFDLLNDDGDGLSVSSRGLLGEAWDLLVAEEALGTPDLLSLSLHSSDENSDISSLDLLEEKITSSRNGDTDTMSTMSQFTSLLSRSGIHGPRHLKAFSLKTRAIRIGNGSQFTVFREISHEFIGNEGLVIKRVNVPFSREDGTRFASSSVYRLHLRTLELEVLALSNPFLRNHRNIVHLVAWGFDYPFTDTPIPVLFMEAALMTLTELLEEDNKGRLGDNPTDIKYQLSLDVTAGIEALHHLGIVHGDVKPDNILIFKEKSEKVPFVAKISDFGVCIDIESETKLTIEDYRGTPGWIAPEILDRSRWRTFEPEIMFRFDSYSLGLTIVSMFTNRGLPLDFDPEMNDIVDSSIDMLRGETEIPFALRTQLTKAARSFLAEDPWKRALPSSDILKTDTPAFALWLFESQKTRKSMLHVGTIDPAYNKGPLFWYRLDRSVLTELEEQYNDSKASGNVSTFPADVLFGMAQTVTGMKPAYIDRLVDYVSQAAKLGFPPARALYAQIIHALRVKSEFDEAILDEWTLQSISEGYIFTRPSARLSVDAINSARQKFRDKGGFCVDEFMRKPNITALARNRISTSEYQQKNCGFIDRRRNTILHVAAAFGSLDIVQALVEDCNVPVNIENDNSETPLYKAAQAGHAHVIHYLLDKGADASKTTKREKLTPLHWLFLLPQSLIRKTAIRLVHDGHASVNATMVPITGDGTEKFAQKIYITHFPFELPMGTPLHWAAFSRNKTAMKVLLDLGADINAVYHNSDASTTPLALAAWSAEPDVVQFLLSYGADGKLKDSKGRNTLHYMTNYVPDLHGYLPHAWHYWIRHGNWDEHLEKMIDLANLLTDAGADVEARDESYPPSTPIVIASSLGVWDGAAICALLNIGADIEDARGASGDSALHTWAAITAPRIDYPESYLYVLEKIADNMNDLDVRNRYDKDTPLHILATIYHTEEEFEAACDILLNVEKPANINAANGRGLTPFSISLGTEQDPGRRALYLAEKGANICTFTDQGKDIFFQIVSNRALTDQQSHDLINQVLSIMAEREANWTTPREVFETYFLPGSGVAHTLYAAATAGLVKTLNLLLDLGLCTCINRVDGGRIPLTALDYALQAAESSRRAYMQLLPAAMTEAARRRALATNAVYDTSQGGPARAAGAYWGLPDVLRLLRSRGAKRACELEPVPRLDLLQAEYILQPGVWDIQEIYDTGYTPQTQPNKDQWRLIYELARYPADWKDETVSSLGELYEEGFWRPHVRLLEASQDTGENIIKEVVDKIVTVQKERDYGQDNHGGSSAVWIEASDHGSSGNNLGYVVEIEILASGRLGGRRRRKKDSRG